MDTMEEELLREANRLRALELEQRERNAAEIARVILQVGAGCLLMASLYFGAISLSRLDLAWGRGVMIAGGLGGCLGLIGAFNYAVAGREERAWLCIAFALLCAFAVGITWPG